MPEISVVIITWNEEKGIGRCLKSVKDIADEIIVIDSFSTDRTGDICGQYGARFIQHAFAGHIEQKNYALDQAFFNHVLCLDADEELSPAMRTSVMEAKNKWTHDAYSFNRLTWYCGKWIRHSTWYPSRKVRLADRRKVRWEGINPHDCLKTVPGATQKHLKGDLLHYSYESVEEHSDKVSRYAALAAQAYYHAGVRSGPVKMIIHPAWRFLRDYLLELGFLDGRQGFTIARLSAKETLYKYRNIRKLFREGNHSTSGKAGPA
jgi:glycosyltransferase involved in cell wall biosynthesis